MQEGDAAKAARKMLSDLMEERRWRIPQLADALGISVDIVRRWQQGKSRMQIDDMVAVAKLKGADLNEVFGLRPGVAKASGGSNVEEIIDRKLEKVIGKIMIAMASAVGSSNGHGDSHPSFELAEKPEAPQRKRKT